jgi:hypothetical protein
LGDGFKAKVYPISKELLKQMRDGNSYRDGCPVSPLDLRVVQLTFKDLKSQDKIGKMILHKDVADEVVEIFKSLYDLNFHINSMKLISDFNGSDEASMFTNNTSAFNCRFVKGTKKYSKHSFGRAIDINPMLNPCVTKDEVAPPNALRYKDRSIKEKGMILKGSNIVNLFKKRGWNWGGDWNSLKDWQHFEKTLN